MKKSIMTFVLLLGVWGFGKAQQTIEDQVADTACACLSAADTSSLQENPNAVKMRCLQEAIVKNNNAITENYATEQRSEDDQEKMGIRGSLLIKVQNVLASSCSVYIKLENQLRTQRESGRAGRR